MSSRAVVVVLLALAVAPMATAGQVSIEVLPHHTMALNAQALRPALSVSELFAEVANPQSEIWADGTIKATAPALDVIVARVSADGGIETVCLHDEKSVVDFLSSDSKQKRTITAAPQEK
jgi:hypothetical protein